MEVRNVPQLTPTQGGDALRARRAAALASSFEGGKGVELERFPGARESPLGGAGDAELRAGKAGCNIRERSSSGRERM